MCRWLPSAWHIAAASLLTLLTQLCRACTVYDLTSAGFAANVWHLLPALGLLADNGSFFVNSERFRYSCSQDGGLVELFNTTALQAYVPWPLPVAAASAINCVLRGTCEALQHHFLQEYVLCVLALLTYSACLQAGIVLYNAATVDIEGGAPRCHGVSRI